MADDTPPSAPSPGAWGEQDEPERPPAPRDVRLASVGVFVLAGVLALNLLLAFTAREAFTDTLTRMSPNLSREEVEAATTAVLGVTVAVGLVVVGLMIWFGVMLRRQRNWARIGVTVLLTLGLLVNLNAFFARGAASFQVIVGATIVALGGVLFLLWRRESSDYFTRAAGRR